MTKATESRKTMINMGKYAIDIINDVSGKDENYEKTWLEKTSFAVANAYLATKQVAQDRLNIIANLQKRIRNQRRENRNLSRAYNALFGEAVAAALENYNGPEMAALTPVRCLVDEINNLEGVLEKATDTSFIKSSVRIESEGKSDEYKKGFEDGMRKNIRQIKDMMLHYHDE